MKLESYHKISIVTPVYNNVKYIEDCITSVLNQEYSNLEYIVIDGGSTDGTAQIIEKYADQLAYYVSEKDSGQTHALNKGFAKATGDVLAWLNADEEYLPGTLMKVSRVFIADPELDFFFGNRVIINEDHNEIGRKRWVPMHPQWHLLYRMSVLPTDASFWSASAHRLTGLLDEENFPQLSMDYDWLLRLSSNVKRWKWTSHYLSKYTERPDRATMRGSFADKNIIQNNSYLARNRVIEYYQYSKVKLFLGWVAAGVWSRIFERRISFPHLILSVKRLYRLE
jgi:glycosyltransferase involved in cell wall biosynthesis